LGDENKTIGSTKINEIDSETLKHGETILNKILSKHRDVPDNATSRDTEESLRIEILKSSLERSIEIHKAIGETEKSKATQRTFFIGFFSKSLTYSLIFMALLIFLDSVCKSVSLSVEIVIAAFTTIIANIFAVLFFMVKYTNDSAYLKAFRTISHKLLDYLVNDKKSDAEDDTQNKNAP